MEFPLRNPAQNAHGSHFTVNTNIFVVKQGLLHQHPIRSLRNQPHHVLHHAPKRKKSIGLGTREGPERSSGSRLSNPYNHFHSYSYTRSPLIVINDAAQVFKNQICENSRHSPFCARGKRTGQGGWSAHCKTHICRFILTTYSTD